MTERDLPDVPYLTGVGLGQWHAVGRESLQYLRVSDVDSVAFAECGELVRLAPKYGAYNRTRTPVTYHPCQPCAWAVADATGELDAEVWLLSVAAADMTHALPDSGIAVRTAQAILDGWPGPEDDNRDARLQLLATVAAHVPVLLVSEACAEGGHDHGSGPCPGTVACAACSLQHGDWAGEWQGTYREECTIAAPCQVLLALAKHVNALDGRSGPGSVTEMQR